MDPMTWLTLCATLAAVASAVFAFVQAKAATDSKKDAEDARNEARAARDESSRLAREANTSFGRQADALERANQLLEEAAPKPEPKFQFQQVSKQRWAVTNNGDAVAYKAQLHIESGIVHVEEDEPRDLTPGDSLFVIATRTFGSGAPRVRLTYAKRVDGELVENESVISIP